MPKRINVLVFIIGLLLASCAGPNEGVNQQTIKTGKHAATPYFWKYSEGNEAKQFTLTPSMVYDHNGRDQLDWNKLTGLSFHPLENHENTAMVGWPYNLIDSLFEFSAYWHKNGEALFVGNGREGSIITGAVGDAVKTHIYRLNGDSVGISIGINQDTILEKMGFDIDISKKARSINPWFGGTLAAPHDIEIIWLYLN